jgi:transposase InsO family protein
VVTAPARREVVRIMKDRGMTERHSLRVVGMSASALRYIPRPDGNAELRQQIVEMAQRHRRYGAPMIYLKLRQAGQRVNHKRVERLYAQEKLQVRRRRRKKIPPADRQPLIRPGAANEIWSMDFVFDRIASGRTLKCLAIVDDATHEAVAVIPEHAIGGEHLVRLMDEVCAIRGRPSIIRTDNVPTLESRATIAQPGSRAINLPVLKRATCYRYNTISQRLPRSKGLRSNHSEHEVRACGLDCA